MDSLGKSWSPFFMKSAQENTIVAKKGIVNRFFELAFFYMIGGFTLICFSEELIKIMTTESYYPAMYVIPAYVFYYLFGIIGQMATNQIMIADKMHYLLPSNIVSAFINIILNIFLIPKYGALGAAIATSVSALISSIVLGYYGTLSYPLPIKISRILGMYVILMIFSSLIIFIMSLDFYFILKILLKLFILFVFIGLGFWMQYLS